MKKIILSVVFAILAITAVNAQKSEGSDFKPFKVDVSLGYALPGGTGAKGGGLFALEPKYAVIPNISVGLRLESAVMVTGSDISSDGNFKAQASVSYLATGDYYFKMDDFKPFAGIGLGIFTTAGVSVQDGNTNSSAIGAASKFGEMIRAGFEYNHFRFGIEYNIVPSTTGAADPSNNTSAYSIKNSYLGIKLGVLIGGGRQ